jgi:hypothetical protein
MVQSKLMPVLIKVLNLRLKYKMQGLEINKYYHVIGYDTKQLIVTGEKADRAYTVRWSDVELVKSEMAIASTRPNIALLTEIQLLRRAAGKFSASIPKKKDNRDPKP